MSLHFFRGMGVNRHSFNGSGAASSEQKVVRRDPSCLLGCLRSLRVPTRLFSTRSVLSGCPGFQGSHASHRGLRFPPSTYGCYGQAFVALRFLFCIFFLFFLFSTIVSFLHRIHLLSFQVTGHALVCRSFSLGGLLAWPTGGCSNKDSCRSERETPTLAQKQTQDHRKRLDQPSEVHGAWDGDAL